eukprot:1143073-Pelagomonas_calceolata.AAC.1
MPPSCSTGALRVPCSANHAVQSPCSCHALCRVAGGQCMLGYTRDVLVKARRTNAPGSTPAPLINTAALEVLKRMPGVTQAGA